MEDIIVRTGIDLYISKAIYNWITSLPDAELRLPITGIRVYTAADCPKLITVHNNCIRISNTAINRSLTQDNVEFECRFINNIQIIALAFQELNILYLRSIDRTPELNGQIDQLKKENTELKLRINKYDCVISAYKTFRNTIDKIEK